MFIDTAKITVQAGKGGKGVDSFYRDKLNVKGFPDGGDGGNGGDIIIRVSTDVHTLLDFRYRQIFKAKNGKHGSSKQQRGRNGETRIIKVPEGTLIFDFETKALIRDLVKAPDEIIIAKGGAGGKGNRSHKSATFGEDGQEQVLFLELKVIADVGIIGSPNAGKSTLISHISKAHPKIAAFPFTTKAPVLGVVEYDDDKTFKIVEIPGLIEDAHKGKGLGDKFLRHAERTKFFIHLIDLSKETADEVISDYNQINKELSLYSDKLADKPQILVGNKIELEHSKNNLKELEKTIDEKVLAISAKDSIGLEELVEAISKKID